MRTVTGALAVFLIVTAAVSSAHAQGAGVVVRGRVTAETGEPLRNVRLETSSRPATPPAFTDVEGRFVMPAVPQDASRVSVVKPGYLPVAFALPTPGDLLEIRLVKAGAISGRISDTSGDPLIGMAVVAETAGAGDAQRRRVATATTDDQGNYRLSGLATGAFFVSITSVASLFRADGSRVDGDNLAATLRAARISDSARQLLRVRSYYPGVQNVASALPVSVAVGEERPAIDFAVAAASPIDVLGGGMTSIVSPRTILASDGSGVIRGRVLTSDGRALRQAFVRLEADSLSEHYPTAVTDAQGRYEFRRLGVRTYTVAATHPGFMAAAFGQQEASASGEPIELRAEETRTNVDVTLPRYGVLSGRVLDNGEAMEGASVRVLMDRYVEGRRRLMDAGGEGTHRTDDRGIYRIYGLPPGRYVVSASAAEPASKAPDGDLGGYSKSYFPGTADPIAAQRVTVALSQEFTNVDISLVKGPTARISGTVVDAEGKPFHGDVLVMPSRRSGALAGDAVVAPTESDGRFSLGNLSPGEYVVQASKSGSGPDDEGETASVFAGVAGAEVSGVGLRLSRGATLRGRLTFEGQWSADSYFGVDLQAVPVDMDRTPQSLGVPAGATVRADGSFQLMGLSGPRVIRLAEAPSDWMLKAVLLDGRDITDTPVTFPAGPAIEGLEVVLTERQSELSGRTVDARGRGVAEATVIVFSTSRDAWSDWSRFIAAATGGKDGGFRIRHLPPGEYYAAAVTEAAPGEWRDPDLLNQLIPSAARVIVFEDQKITATLRAVRR